MNIVRTVVLALAASALLVAPLASQAEGGQHPEHAASSRSVLIDTVREATASFRDVRNVPPGYGAVLGCVSGPDAGAMGVHFVNAELLLDNELNARRPEALIYEFKDGAARLVGVEFIVVASGWHETHALNDPPALEGQLLQFVDSPNRFGLPAHYEIHVWSWRNSPNGAFVDWHPLVSCEGV